MTIFIDASALVAIIKNEPEAYSFIETIGKYQTRLTSGLAMWEAIRAVAKAGEDDIAEASRLCECFRLDFGIVVVPIDHAAATEAVDAHRRYGKGSGHPARLNMGDCFAYACAKTNAAALLYKGDDFIHTDLG
ncbi:type II toxin-antitoxin system VapC family toxin [Sphingomonas mollis]|uniref:Ribonuclease VapC n=1 Tax=Sphingomonas mollis TaxID=2795726 RepID=A0ABS0XLH7_9SPHN|nr:type II toxin-antitoxin system VapC family toxin [Sphingomonas sp. BT553]MBJ6120573.1 type II toxin-antitoxin system VapC family toxin [Sphingomonas sp. BT553]